MSSFLPDAFGEMLGELDPSRKDLLQIAGAKLVEARLSGETCISLEMLRHAEPERNWDQLSQSPLVGLGANCPIAAEKGKLYLRRFRELEESLAENLVSRVGRGTGVSRHVASGSLEQICPAGDLDSGQQAAALSCLTSKFNLVTGGPGTGKTRLLLRVLAATLALQGAEVRILLAAPTGKAAARMEQALGEGIESLDLPEALRTGIPTKAQTLHRMLGITPWRMKGIYSAKCPLPCELLVVDEASMVDLELMSRTLAALSPDAGLLLLGDADQLASVEAGSVLADLVDGLESLPESPVSRLLVSHRFSAEKGLGKLSAAIQSGNADAVLGVLESSGECVTRETPTRALFQQLREHLGKDCESAEEAFSQLGRSRLLCAVRNGPLGVKRVNQLVEQESARRGQRYSPVLVRRNEASLGLANGDSGIMDSEQISTVYFPDSDKGLRGLQEGLLPAWDKAWAITVHQSQGSEYDHVLLLLPGKDSPVLSRELLYTAVTRARISLKILGDPEQIRHCVNRRTLRNSGLVERLRDKLQLAPSEPEGVQGTITF